MGVRSLARAQAAADRQPVLARQHQVQHDQVDVSRVSTRFSALAVFGQQHFEALLREVAAQQVADAGVVVDDDDAVGAGVGQGGFIDVALLDL